MNLEKIRKEYSFQDGDIYFNIAREGLPPLCVQTAVEEYNKACYRTKGTKGTVAYADLAPSVAGEFAKLIGAKQEEIAIVKNTTEGISIFANGYGFKPDDEVIISAQEFPSCLFPFINMSEKGRLKAVVIEDFEPEITVESIFSRVTDKTKAVVISAVQYSTGFFADLKEIGRRCKEQNILFVVDAIQAMGRMKVDVNECNIDYLATGGHKALLGVHGVGFVFCRENLIPEIKPPYAARQSTFLGGNDLPSDFTKIDWHKTATRLESGVNNHFAMCAFSSSLGFINELGIENIQKHVMELEDILRTRISSISEKVLTFSSPVHNSGILCIDYPKEMAEGDVIAKLEEKDIFATVRNGYIRVAIGLHNTIEEIELVANVICELYGAAVTK